MSDTTSPDHAADAPGQSASKRRRRRKSGSSKGSASPARVAAARALLDIERGAHSDHALAQHAPSDGRERGLAWFLVLGALQRRGQIDAALRDRLSRPIESLDPPVRVALRLGTFEKLFGRAAPHAVVHQGVEIVRAIGAPRAAGLVNAVLRRVEPAASLAEHDALDHPAWLVARWTERYGPEATCAWCEMNGTPAPLAVALHPRAADLPGRWQREGLRVEPARAAGAIVPLAALIIDPPGAVPELEGFDQGDFWVQDPAAVAVADLVRPQPGDRVLDACAAPGGKSARLAAAGARVTSVDRADRLGLLDELNERLGLQVERIEHDWLNGPCPALVEPFDTVLVDAPCTGLGTVRRHPEIRWRRQLPDLLAAAERQRKILAAAATHVAPGGRLIYAVCSPEPEEGVQVVADFLQAHPAFEQHRALNTAPPQHDEDGHYAAVLTRCVPA